MSTPRFVRVSTDGVCGECVEPIRAGDMTVLRCDDSYAHVEHYGRQVTIVRWDYEPTRESASAQARAEADHDDPGGRGRRAH